MVEDVGTLTFLIVVLGTRLVISDSLSIVCTYVYVCCWLLWVGTLKAGTSKLKCEAWPLIMKTSWWTIMPRLCSVFDLQFLNSEPRYTNCELNFASESWSGNDDRTAWRGRKWGLNMLYVRAKWAAWRPVNGSLGPTAWLDVVKVVPRPFVLSSDQPFWDRFGAHFGRFLRQKRR